MTKEVLYRLEASRKELLDLGLRNPLINYRKRAKQVNVVDELTREIYRLLVTDGRKMSFKALPEAKLKRLAEIEVDSTKDPTTINWEDLLSQPEEEIAGKKNSRSPYRHQIANLPFIGKTSDTITLYSQQCTNIP